MDPLANATVNVALLTPLLASRTLTEPGDNDTTGGATATSSLRIVPVAFESVPSVAPLGADKVIVNVSSASTAVSPVTATLTVCEVTPAANVNVPDAAV